MKTWHDLRPVGFDFETSGTLEEYALQPHRVATGDAWVTSFVAMAKAPQQPIAEWGSIMPARETIKAWLDQMIAQQATIVGWNVQFDVQWLMALGFVDECYALSWLDGMLLWRHLTVEPEYEVTGAKRQSYSLKDAVRKYLPDHADYEEDVDYHSQDPAALAALHAYNRKDVVFTLWLARKFYQELMSMPRTLKAAMIETRSIPMVAEANWRGMPVDTGAAQQLSTMLQETAAQTFMRLALTAEGITEAVLRSPKQLATLLFDTWGLPPVKMTSKGGRSTDKETLDALAVVDQRAALLQQFREAENNRTKFAEGPLQSAQYNGDGHVRPQARIFGTYTGRVTYSSKQGKGKKERPIGFAIHQTKRAAQYRSLIVAPPGMALVEFDAAGQEFRWMAIASGDPVMLALCEPGEDPHAYMGANIFDREYREVQEGAKVGDAEAKNMRQAGKVANLSLQFRTGAARLQIVARVQYKLTLSLAEVDRIVETYRRVYSRVPKYWDRQTQFGRQHAFVETLAGRRVNLPQTWGPAKKWSIESTTINYPIQGTGADQKYLAMASMRSVLREIGGRFAWDLHDGIYLFIPWAQVRTAVPRLHQLLHALPYERAWGFTPPIPLPWDCKIGTTWGNLEEYSNERVEALLSAHQDGSQV